MVVLGTSSCLDDEGFSIMMLSISDGLYELAVVQTLDLCKVKLRRRLKLWLAR